MNRQRIQQKRARVADLEMQLVAAKRDLDEAERSFDVGDRVRWVETCDRGCCTEGEYVGTITGPAFTHWNVKTYPVKCDGAVRNIEFYKLTYVEPEPREQDDREPDSDPIWG